MKNGQIVPLFGFGVYKVTFGTCTRHSDTTAFRHAVVAKRWCFFHWFCGLLRETEHPMRGEAAVDKRSDCGERGVLAVGEKWAARNSEIWDDPIRPRPAQISVQQGAARCGILLKPATAPGVAVAGTLSSGDPGLRLANLQCA